MGRLIGIRHFVTEAALNEERPDITELHRAKASLREDYDPLEILEDSEDPIAEAQTAIARSTVKLKGWEKFTLKGRIPKKQRLRL